MDGDSCDETEASSEDLTSTSEAKDEYEESEYLSDHPSSSSPCFGTKVQQLPNGVLSFLVRLHSSATQLRRNSTDEELQGSALLVNLKDPELIPRIFLTRV